MSIGVDLEPQTLTLTRHRDFRWALVNQDDEGNEIDYPAGSLFIELYTQPETTNWDFTISGAVATLKVESTVVDTIPDRVKWQLVWLPASEAAGGDPVALGTVRVQG